MKIRNNICGLAVLSVAFSVPMSAQEASKKCFEPGTGPEFTIAFSGEEAKKLTAVNVRVTSKETQKPEQRYFATSVWGEQSNSSPTGIFTVKLNIPQDLASGLYSIDLIRANVSNITLDYVSSEFTAPAPFAVCNPRSLDKPPIKKVSEKQ